MQAPAPIAQPKLSRVLVVDDSPPNLQLVGSLLRSHGYHVVPAPDGLTALQRVAAHAPDLILLDVMMPGLDGFEVCRRLKADPDYSSIPVVFLTGANEAQQVVAGFEMGAVDYVTKPFNAAELLARVRTHLELKHSREALVALYRERKETVLLHELETARRDGEIHRLRNVELAEANERITEGLRYAERIQRATLPSPAQLRAVFPRSFAFYQPKDIVSGDFYWVAREDGPEGAWEFAAVADCTGHGVPAALMSVLGYSLLNEIVSKRGRRAPADILRELESALAESLETEAGELVEAGLDVVLIARRQGEGLVHYALAHRPLWAWDPTQPDTLREFRGGLANISTRPRKGPAEFAAGTLPLVPGLRLFLSTDGVADTPSRTGRALGSPTLRHWLAESSSLPSPAQGGDVLRRLQEHRAGAEWIDDATLLILDFGA